MGKGITVQFTYIFSDELLLLCRILLKRLTLDR